MPNPLKTPRQIEKVGQWLDMIETNAALGADGTHCCGSSATIGYTGKIVCFRCQKEILVPGQ